MGLTSARMRLMRAGTSTLFAAASYGSLDAYAADTLAPPKLDALSSTSAPSPEGLSKGDIKASISAAQQMYAQTRDRDVDQGSPTSASRVSLLLSTSLAERLELTLGLHGTHEPKSQMTSDQKEQPVPDTAFSGASLLAKVKVLSARGFTAAIAPFAESGAGQDASYTHTRSVGPKTGAFLALGYRLPSWMFLGLDLGLRYRRPEILQTKTLRHERLAHLTLEGSLPFGFSAFSGYDVRSIQVHDNAGSVAAKYQWRTGTALEYGLGFRFEEIALNVGMSHRLSGGEEFSKTAMFASLSYSYSSASSRRPSFADEVARSESPVAVAKPPVSAEPTGTLGNATADESSPTFVGPPRSAMPDSVPSFGPIDTLDAGEGVGDDFKDIGARAEKIRREGEVESEDARIERELREIKAEEARQAQEQARLEAEEQKLQQEAAQARAKADSELMREWMEEAQRAAEKLDGITEDEIGWTGLED